MKLNAVNAVKLTLLSTSLNKNEMKWSWFLSRGWNTSRLRLNGCNLQPFFCASATKMC